jgi:hypothetical protein
MLCRLALVDDRVRRVAASRATSTGVEPLVERVRDRVPRLLLRRSFYPARAVARPAASPSTVAVGPTATAIRARSMLPK